VDRNEIILGITALTLVVYSLVVALVVPRRYPNFPGKRLGLFVGVSAALVIGMLTAVETLGESHHFNEAEAATGATPPAGTVGIAPPSPTTSEQSAPPPSGASTGAAGGAAQGDPAAGKKVFETAGCTSCHTLADAGATGTVGPNLDEAKPPHDLVVERVTNGKPPMPPFKGQLSEQQIQDVAAYVVQATSG
jgi:mono/diheme cytochrome c family protein